MKLRHLHGIHLGNETSSDEDMFIGALQKGQSDKEWQVTISINGQKAKFKVDTGAQCNAISKQKYLAVSQTLLQKSKAKLTAFGGHKLHTLQIQ